ncbi:uncharacterized protein LOC111025101 [Momordica charantia]|uniref:Uncharacterized protein LOC111025101 n=1 Tax=Momordica charantia TaxID=3673 RepID=A0A6J1E007_MOMCH|nr:uncharacterized protein LOC111025101 [Momordica charantia]
MSGCKPTDTPMDANSKLGVNPKDEPVDRGIYQRLVAKLIYLTHTRLDISFAVSVVSQFLNKPSKEHMEDAYRILRYLKHDPENGLMFRKTTNQALEVYNDADWVRFPIDWKSTSGYCSYVWGNLVIWRSKKQ